MKTGIDKIIEAYKNKIELNQKEIFNITEELLNSFKEYLQLRNGFTKSAINVLDESFPQVINQNFYFQPFEFKLFICGTIYITEKRNNLYIYINCFLIIDGKLLISNHGYCINHFIYDLSKKNWTYNGFFSPEMYGEFDYIPDKFKEIFPDIGW